MQLDKDTLIKYHFWILLGVYMPLALVGLLLLWTSVSGAVDKEAAELKKTKDDLKGANKSDHKNQKWKAVLEQKTATLGDQKDKMWKQVWDAQASIMTWPDAIVGQFPELRGLYFLDKLSYQIRDKFVNNAATGYFSQYVDPFKGIYRIVEPVDSKGEGTVQFKEGNWTNVLWFVPPAETGGWPDVKGTGSIPDSDDCWLAQEDLWVQRELLYVVKAANDIAASFTKVANPPPPDRKKGEIDRQVFVNARWKLDLIAVAQKGLQWQLTNLTGRRQPISMSFRVQRKGVSIKDWLWVDGEPLAPLQASRWGTQQMEISGLANIESVEEVLDWRSATVKRIDGIDLYHHSHRTYMKGLKALEPKTDPNAPAAAAPPPPPAGGPDAAGGPGMEGMAGMRGAAPEIVVKNRYIDVNDFVRRMAIGMVLIVDQSRIQDVLTALANSRLRIQITQVHWQHYQGSIKPPVIDEKQQTTDRVGRYGVFNYGEDDRPMRGMSRWGGTNLGRMGSEAMMPGARSVPPGMNPSMAPGSDIVTDESANTVELAVYGIASLYQKFPPKPPEPAAPDAAGGAATPGAPGATPPGATPAVPPK